MKPNYKAYYHRYGTIEFEECATIPKAKEFIGRGAAAGELFGDAIVDSDGVIVFDFDFRTDVAGREKPKNRKGTLYSEEGSG